MFFSASIIYECDSVIFHLNYQFWLSFFKEKFLPIISINFEIEGPSLLPERINLKGCPSCLNFNSNLSKIYLIFSPIIYSFQSTILLNSPIIKDLLSFRESKIFF